MNETFGPAVETLPDGTLRALCTWCKFRVDTACTWDRQNPVRQLGGLDTPDWCPMKADMLAEVGAVRLAGRPAGGQDTERSGVRKPPSSTGELAR